MNRNVRSPSMKNCFIDRKSAFRVGRKTLDPPIPFPQAFLIKSQVHSGTVALCRHRCRVVVSRRSGASHEASPRLVCCFDANAPCSRPPPMIPTPWRGVERNATGENAVCLLIAPLRRVVPHTGNLPRHRTRCHDVDRFSFPVPVVGLLGVLRFPLLVPVAAAIVGEAGFFHGNRPPLDARGQQVAVGTKGPVGGKDPRNIQGEARGLDQPRFSRGLVGRAIGP
mmetsp:Transcript_10879/g.23048  ORF Transcript_10879/g.23048 Transcript_10879/m.23048 type:complete len:224 (-) Transcript_10879:1459-2130(-)